jgi:hypothetical protein
MLRIFYTKKIQRRTREPEASMLTTRPPKPSTVRVTKVSLNISGLPTALHRIFQELYSSAVNIFVRFVYLKNGVTLTHDHPLSPILTPQSKVITIHSTHFNTQNVSLLVLRTKKMVIISTNKLPGCFCTGDAVWRQEPFVLLRCIAPS